jgi:outer membrane protein assembly factor BamB
LKVPKFAARNRLALIVLVISLLVLTGCVGTRIGVSWAALSLVDDDRYILVAYNDFLVVINPATGRPIELRNPQGEVRVAEDGTPRRWEIRGGETGSEFFSTPVWLDDEMMLVADYNNRLFRVNYPAARIENPTGYEVPGHVIANLVESGDTVVVALSERNLVAFDVATLDRRWEFETDRGVWTEPLVVDGVVYAPSIDQHLYAVDLETGAEIWSLHLEGAMAATPAYVDGRLYIGTIGRRVFEVSPAGEILSEYQTEDWVWSTPVVRDGILYVADLSGHVYALDTTDGLSEIWRSQPTTGGIRARPLVTETNVIVASRDGRAYWLERATGLDVFSQEVGAEILSDMLLLEPNEAIGLTERLVVISTVRGDKTLVAFTVDGAPRWTYER